jgi:cell division transport system ATP-binding protein
MRLMQLFIALNKLGSNIIIATHNEQLVARFGYSRLALADSALTELPPLSDGNAAEYDQTINEPQA